MALEVASSNSRSDFFSTHKVPDAWKHFTKMQDKKKAICSIYRKVLEYSGGTTNLHKYLSSKSLLQYFSTGNDKKTTKSKMKTLDGFVTPSKCTETYAKEITDLVSQTIIQDLRLIRMVKCDGFQNLLSYLQPCNILPSWKQFSMDISHNFETCKEKLKNTWNLKHLL